jgi:arginine decarboxylase
MNVEIVWGTGEGQTSLSAFDAALADGGIHNYNLVTLSSVIPEDTEITETGTHERQWDVGELVGVVLAENESTVVGETISAGLGWATADEGGIFFEATAESAANVEALLTRGIQTAQSERSDWNWDEGIETRITQHTVEQNGAVIVSAIYRPV